MANIALNKATIINGGTFTDARGTLRFANDFDMKDVRRFYCIRNGAGHLFRGWIAHKVERKWFFPLTGIIAIHVIPVEDFDAPLPCGKESIVALDAASPAVLPMPGRFAFGIESKSADAEVVVFSDRTLGEVKGDTWRWTPDGAICPDR